MSKKISLNMNQLKNIAMFFMLIDHLAYVMIEKGIGLYGNWYTIDRVMRGMGRIAFPIFCFTIVEGFQKTSNAYAYLKRLLIFALISEIPFDLAFRGTFFAADFQNVFWTLAFGLTLLIFYENRTMEAWKRTLGIVACFLIPYLVHTDYSIYGVLVIFLMYRFRNDPVQMCLSGYVILLLQTTTEVWSVFGFLLILLYNGQRGKGSKFLYYAFYPAHLLLLCAVKPYIVSWLSGMVGVAFMLK